MKDVSGSLLQISSFDLFGLKQIVKRILLACCICFLVLIDVTCGSSVLCGEEAVCISHDYVGLAISHADDLERNIRESL